MENIQKVINTTNQSYRRYSKGRLNKKTGIRGKVHKWGAQKKHSEMRALFRMAKEDAKNRR